MATLQDKGEHLLPAIAYGDAAGLPFETKSAQEIAERYGRIDRLYPASENPYFTGSHAPGDWSDDTQLSSAVAEALISADGFDLAALADAHLKAYDATPDITNKRGETVKQGWGGSTVAAMERLKQGVAPWASGTLGGGGNGVLMKMAPLVFWQFARNVPERDRHRQYDELTSMTHDSDSARLTTRVHGDVLTHLIARSYDKPRLLAHLDDIISLHEYETGTNGQIRDLLAYLHGNVTTESILMHTDGKGFDARQTLAMTYGAFVLGRGDLQESIYSAVTLGGDTDSTASIAAAMSVLASNESIRMPEESKQIRDLSRLQGLSQRLAVSALNKSQSKLRESTSSDSEVNR